MTPFMLHFMFSWTSTTTEKDNVWQKFCSRQINNMMTFVLPLLSSITTDYPYNSWKFFWCNSTSINPMALIVGVSNINILVKMIQQVASRSYYIFSQRIGAPTGTPVFPTLRSTLLIVIKYQLTPVSSRYLVWGYEQQPYFKRQEDP